MGLKDLRQHKCSENLQEIGWVEKEDFIIDLLTEENK